MPYISEFNLSKSALATLDGSCYNYGPQTGNNPNGGWGIGMLISTGNGSGGWNWWIAIPTNNSQGLYIKCQINQDAWTAWEHIT